MSTDSSAQAWNNAAQAINTGTAAIAQSQRGKKAHERSKELMDIQQKNQMRLNEQGHQMQMQLWKDTNAPAQMEMLREAGLNPALIYGGSGAGGSTTTGSQTGGSAGSGTSHAPMDIGAAIAAAQTASQVKLMNAQAEKTEEEAKGVQIDNEIRDFAGTEADKFEASNRRDAALSEGQILFEGKKDATNMFEKLSLAEKEGFMQEMIGKQIENEAKKAGIQLTREKVNEIWHSVRQKWVQTGFKGLDSIISGIFKTGVLKQAGKMKK